MKQEKKARGRKAKAINTNTTDTPKAKGAYDMSPRLLKLNNTGRNFDNSVYFSIQFSLKSGYLYSANSQYMTSQGLLLKKSVQWSHTDRIQVKYPHCKLILLIKQYRQLELIELKLVKTFSIWGNAADWIESLTYRI